MCREPKEMHAEQKRAKVQSWVTSSHGATTLTFAASHTLETLPLEEISFVAGSVLMIGTELTVDIGLAASLAAAALDIALSLRAVNDELLQIKRVSGFSSSLGTYFIQ